MTSLEAASCQEKEQLTAETFSWPTTTSENGLQGLTDSSVAMEVATTLTSRLRLHEPAEILVPMLKELQRFATAGPAAEAALTSLHAQDICVRLLKHSEESVLEEASAALANLAGTAACNPHVCTWAYQNNQLELQVGTYVEAGLGFQLWPCGAFLARQILDKAIDVQGQRVLELGCGVGLVGLACVLAKCAEVVLTDANEAVLKLAQANIVANKMEGTATVNWLDWHDFQPANVVLSGSASQDYKAGQRSNKSSDANWANSGAKFPIIVASDVVYDSDHAAMLPHVIDEFLSADSQSVCYVALPSAKHRNGIDAFERNIGTAFHVNKTDDCTIIGHEERRALYTLRRKERTGPN